MFPHLSKHRTEALVDGIYAVAMTLLVLDLKLPEFPQGLEPDALLHELVKLFPKFLAWAISFFVLATFWLSHQRTFDYVRRVDKRLIWINIYSLLFVSLLPFSSDLVGEHAGYFVSQVVYAANLATVAALSVWEIRYLDRHAELCEPVVPSSVVRGVELRCFSIIGVCLLAVIVAWFNPRYGSMAYVLMALIGRFTARPGSSNAASTAPSAPPGKTSSSQDN